MERATADVGDGDYLERVVLMANVGGGCSSDMVVGILVKFDLKNILAKYILHLGISTRSCKKIVSKCHLSKNVMHKRY